MDDIKLDDFENKVIEIFNKKKEDIYKELLDRLNYEDRRLNLIERVIRIEEELRNQRELIEKLLHQMDKRFDQIQREMDKRFDQIQREMDKRFELLQKQMDDNYKHVDKRFNLLTWVMGIGFTIMISLIVTVLNFVLK